MIEVDWLSLIGDQKLPGIQPYGESITNRSICYALTCIAFGEIHLFGTKH